VISSQAIVHSTAELADDVSVGPFSIIGPDVMIGRGTVVGPHVVINGATKIGENNHFFQFASIGEVPQDKKFSGESSSLEIGDNNVFREGCTIHRGTKIGGGKTVIGSGSLFMAYSHVAHDCVIGDNVVFANNASVAGHVCVDDYASLGGFVGVHQFCSIGAHSFAAGFARISKDVPPFVTVAGAPATATGLNLVGLERRGFDKATRLLLKRAYKLVFRDGLTLSQSLDELVPLLKEHNMIRVFYDFLKQSNRGIIR